MSYNIDTWKTKQLDGLQIPLKSLRKHERKDWHPVRHQENGESCFQVIESVVRGKVKDGVLHVTSLDISGEGSGTAMEWIWAPALADSKGTLVATRIWEGGDTVDRVTVVDGVVTVEEIDV